VCVCVGGGGGGGGGVWEWNDLRGGLTYPLKPSLFNSLELEGNLEGEDTLLNEFSVLLFLTLNIY
jgi:hypothetical protein